MASGKFSALYDTEEQPRLAGSDAGPEARRAARGAPPGPRAMVDEGAGPQRDDTKVYPGAGPAPGAGFSTGSAADQFAAINAERAAKGLPPAKDALEGDPMAQGIVGTAMTMPIAGPVLGAAARGGVVARTLAQPAVGAAQGGLTAKMTGGDVKEGAAMGALFSLPAAIESVGIAMRPGGSLDTGVVKDMAPDMTAPNRQQARHLGYAKVAETSRRYGVVGAPNPERAHASVKAGVEAVGSEIGQVYDSIGGEFARPTGGFMANVKRETQGMRGTVDGNRMADVIEAEAKQIQDLAGGSGSSTMTLKNIRAELTKRQEAGYGKGKFEKLDDSEAAEVGQVLARNLRTELEAGLAMAKQDPRFTGMVDRLKDLNPTYSALKVLEETTGRQVDRAMLKNDPTIIERARAMQPVGGAPLPAKVTPVKMPSGMRLGTKLPTTPLAIQPGLANAFHRRAQNPSTADPNEIAVELAKEFFGNRQ